MPLSQIAVVLSAYNGQQYLAEQVNSILAQEDVDVRLLIRDDGSRDAAVEWTRELASHHPKVSFVAGANKGITGSFLAALEQADPACEFFAFSDQDDVWYPRKLANAVETLRSAPDPDSPLLYCSKLELVDEKLGHLAYTKTWRNISFKNAWFQNVVCGCTIVMNRAARQLVLRGTATDSILMHDWWCYLAVSAFGHVLYDDRPSIMYRQHGNNYIGAEASLPARARRRLIRTLNGVYGRFPSEQNDFFMEVYGQELTEDMRRFAEKAIDARRSLLKRFALAWSREISMQTRIEDIFTRLGILLNRY
ncbi:glycosyltransferase family 2 protein [Paraburkholderia phosphatilytica]|uniref:glycosyltransferase family 2 protein n=1 Tax=Paraburkholderia phosphatilytica TaxID=2282883 RepID=UPI000E53BA9F|nr:glycosyltransferase family 2 protein [Paraburkholderia phosphatilytica]